MEKEGISVYAGTESGSGTMNGVDRPYVDNGRFTLLSIAARVIVYFLYV